MTELSANRRILAVWLPRFSTDRLKRQWALKGATDKRPLVLIAKAENAIRLSAVDAHAAKLGLYPGMALADARARIPALCVHEADAACDALLLGRLADWCERYSPLVALDGKDGLLFDITGVAHLFGVIAGRTGADGTVPHAEPAEAHGTSAQPDAQQHNESAMLAHVCHAFAAMGFAVQGAVAGTADAASALARFAPGTVTASDEDATAVFPLPVVALAADPNILHGLKRAGLKTIGAVASRGRAELAARFGQDFLALLDRTLGRRENPISPRTPMPDCMAERHFPEPILAEDVIAETIAALAERLGEVLEKRGAGARAIAACFFRVDGKMRRLVIETAEPTRDVQRVAGLFHEKMSALSDPLDAGFGFDLIRLSAVRTETLHARVVSFDESENAKREISFLIDRLATRFGVTRILCFHPQDTHIPEASAVTVPAQFAVSAAASWQRMRISGEPPQRPLRLFEKPEPVEVMADVPDGPPAHFRWRRVLHRVIRAEGPERIAMEWWKKEAFTRDYFRVEDEAGRRFWLYRDGLFTRETTSPRWYMHGMFT